MKRPQIIIKMAHIAKEKFWRWKWFRHKKSESKFRGIIFCVDGRVWHGGMNDRFKGIISTYNYCKKNNIPFRINYTFPFKLEDYLQPNKYDWRLKDGEFSEVFKDSEILYLNYEPKLERLRNPKKRQIHVYANLDALSFHENAFEWGKLFNELFLPSEDLQNALSQLRIDNYIAAVFRFQNLLGDFKEYNFQPLEDDEKKKLMEKCKSAIEELHVQNPYYKILVTSDSSSFLNYVQDLSYLRIIPGTLVHIDTTQDSINERAFLKSFVDYFMISQAQKVYGIGTGQMYPSDFPKYAAKINNVEFERIIIE